MNKGEDDLKRWMSKTLLAALCGVTVSGFAGTAKADTTTTNQTILEVVDPSTQYQTFQGWGTSLCWFANVIGGAPDSIRNNYADMIFDPQKGLGFNVVRYNIGGGENPIYNFEEPRANMPGYEMQPGVWNWEADSNQRWFVQAAKDRGANVFEAFSNSAPYWMTNSGSVTGAKGGGNNLNPDDYQTFADYLVAVTKHFQDNWGIQFSTLEPLNEPISGWWTFGNRQEGMHFDAASQAKMIDALGANLESNHLLTRVSASDENTIDLMHSTWNTFDAQTKSYVAQINTHTYGGSQRAALNDDAVKSGKQLSMSEHGDGDGTGMQMSQDILGDLNSMHVQNWVYWQAVDGGGWGLLNMDPNHPGTDYTYTLNEKYYVMANYSKFIRPGYKIIAIDNSQSVAAYSEQDHKLVIVSTNNSNSPQNLSFDVSKFNTVGNVVNTYQTSATQNLQKLDPIPVNYGTFNTTVGPKTVTTFEIDNVNYQPAGTVTLDPKNVGTGLNQYTYNGNWSLKQSNPGQDSNKSSSVNDSYSVAFNGTQAILYGEKGPHMGIVNVAVNGGQPAAVDLYAPHQEHNVFIYATPTVQSGQHTLVVKNTGLLNSNELNKSAVGSSNSEQTANDTPYMTADQVVVVPNNTLLQNESFETGSLGAWQGEWNPTLAGVETNYPYSGLYDAFLHPNSSHDVALYQTLTAPETGSYTLTAYCATNIANGVQLGVDLDATQVSNLNVAANVGYAPYTIHFQAKQGQTIKVWYYANRKSGWATIDSVRLIADK